MIREALMAALANANKNNTTAQPSFEGDIDDTTDDNPKKGKKKLSESIKEKKAQLLDTISEIKEKRNRQAFLNERMGDNVWGIYGSILDEKGREIKNPTREQAIKTMIEYMKHNIWTESNIYRPQWEHKVLNWNKKEMEKKMKDI